MATPIEADVLREAVIDQIMGHQASWLSRIDLAEGRITYAVGCQNTAAYHYRRARIALGIEENPNA